MVAVQPSAGAVDQLVISFNSSAHVASFNSDKSLSTDNEIKSTPRGNLGTSLDYDGDGSPDIMFADGRELFFRNATTVMSVAIETSSTSFRPAAPAPIGLTARVGVWAVSKAGDRFLLGDSPEGSVQTPITVVTNWEAMFRR